MLEIKGVSFHPATSEKQILSDINLKADFSKPLIIAGKSGSGKTSLIEIISGLSKPEKGKIYWNGRLITQRQSRWLCGVVFQFPERYFLGLTVAQELKMGYRKINSKLQEDVLSQVGLSGIDLKKAPEKLSGGQQRRLALAVQLLRQPSILLLDEPTAGLDWSVRGDLIKLLKDLSRTIVLILVTHENELFQNWEESTLFLKSGKIDNSF